MLHNWLVGLRGLKRERRELGMLTKEEYSQEERTLYKYRDSDMERH